MKEKRNTYYKLLMVPLGMYCIMILIAVFWCLADAFGLTQPVWLSIGVVTGILFMALSGIAPLTGLIMGIASLVLKRRHDVETSGAVSAKGQEAADKERKAEKSWRVASVLNLVLSVISVALCVYFVLLIRSL